MALKVILYVGMFMLAVLFMFPIVFADVGADMGLKADTAKNFKMTLLFCFLCSSFAMICITTIFGRKWDRRYASAILLAVQTAGLALMALTKTHEYYWIWLVLVGCAMHSLFGWLSDLILAAYKGKDAGVMLNRHYMAFALGFVLTPVIIGALGAKNFRTLFWAVCAVQGLTAVAILLSGLQAEKKEVGVRGKALGEFLADWRLYAFGTAILFYVGAEYTISVWTKDFAMLKDGASLEEQPALLLGTLFWIAMTVGRFFIGDIGKKVGTGKLTILITALSVACTFGIVHMGSFVSLAILYVIAGLLMAGIYGFIISMMTEQLPENTGDVTSAMVLFTSAGVVVLTIIVGGVKSTSTMLYVPAALVVALLALLLVASRTPAPATSSQEN